MQLKKKIFTWLYQHFHMLHLHMQVQVGSYDNVIAKVQIIFS
jgi:hypothetical protein